ncbi:ketosynthase chain-length factor [Nonomuraea sp. KC401]|uniref:ketosynthase chain-length factor n=1 Tax=unclassified Nonomuraea TaxID=2593643 RepID=UPI0010FE5F91|nr:ketosynthase chain-length factor [Nonomuraea sp. KC401]NBE93741.1 ketosynthase chain-length factor [Nonomuraea sp. K271]TLF77002.1 ketosynthase chain-length factor [Nonomuraea sp. KC401]
MTTRYVVTGIGATAPNGLGNEEFWSATLAGRSGIGRITRFDPEPYPVTLAGQVRGFAADEHLPAKITVQTDLMTHLALVASEMALADAGIDPARQPEYEMAVMTANSSGGNEFGQREIQALWSNGPRHVGAYQSIAWFYAASTGQISIRHGMRGPCGVIATEQAGGLDALSQARRALRQGAGMVLTGGTDASLSPYGLVTQLPTGMLSRSADPARAYLPFDAEACGYVPGEGGAILVMEEERAARARGAARIYGEIAGYAATFDPAPGSGRPPGLLRAVKGALADAGIAPGDVDVVFADAKGVPEADLQEAGVLAEIFGPGGVPVTAPKTMTGRLYAGGAALDVAAALLAVHHSVIPPTTNVTRPAPGCDIDLVLDVPRAARVGTALVVARGHGGFNSAVVVRAAGG